MDFGLAKGQSLELTASRAGGLLGTLRYAAPEQLAAASLKVGPAADVRGLGVTLWELLTRRRLFAEAEDERQLADHGLRPGRAPAAHDRPRPRSRPGGDRGAGDGASGGRSHRDGEADGRIPAALSWTASRCRSARPRPPR